MLPSPSQPEEDAFIEALQTAPTDEIIQVVISAMEEGRPKLAARAVNLLDEQAARDHHPAVERARQASRMLLFTAPDLRGPVIAELEAAVSDLKAQFVSRARTRQRRIAKGAKPGGRRKPRSTRGR